MNPKQYVTRLSQSTGTSRDVITFNLQEMSKVFAEERPLMSGKAGNFEEALKSWIRYAHEQDESTPVQGPPL